MQIARSKRESTVAALADGGIDSTLYMYQLFVSNGLQFNPEATSESAFENTTLDDDAHRLTIQVRAIERQTIPCADSAFPGTRT